MRQKSGPPKETSDQVVKDIRRATRKRYSADEKIRADSSPSRLCASVAGQKSGHPGNVGQTGSDAVKRRGKPIVGA
jgi:hypothetical protein